MLDRSFDVEWFICCNENCWDSLSFLYSFFYNRIVGVFFRLLLDDGEGFSADNSFSVCCQAWVTGRKYDDVWDFRVFLGDYSANTLSSYPQGVQEVREIQGDSEKSVTFRLIPDKLKIPQKYHNFK